MTGLASVDGPEDQATLAILEGDRTREASINDTTLSHPTAQNLMEQPTGGQLMASQEQKVTSESEIPSAKPADAQILSTSSPASDQPVPEKPVKAAGATPVPSPEKKPVLKSWSAKEIIQAFKELVTAVLGLLIVGYTLSLAYRAFAVVGEQQKMSDTKDILLLMLGLAGVVVGYYFGRVPADAQASQAQEQAQVATAQAEQVQTQAQIAADQLEQVMDQVAPTAGARSAGVPSGATVTSELQRIRDELRAIARSGRR